MSRYDVDKVYIDGSNPSLIKSLSSCRSKVIEMRSRGLSQVEIAQELQVSKASISSDMQYLHNPAKADAFRKR